MDANGTRHHLLLHQQEWSAIPLGEDDPVAWDEHEGALTLAPLSLDVRRRDEGATRLSPRDRRGGARDRHGTWWLIGADARSIVSHEPQDQTLHHEWPRRATDPDPRPSSFRESVPPPPPSPSRLRGIAVTRDQHLLVGRPDDRDVIVFDLHAGGDPHVLRLPEQVVPRDIAAAPDGEVWLLEGPADGPARLWLLDRYLRPCPLGPPPADVEGTPVRFTPDPPADTADDRPASPPATPLPVPPSCTAVAAIGGGRAAVLDRGATDAVVTDPAVGAALLVVGPPDGNGPAAEPVRRPLDVGEHRPHDLAVVPPTDDGHARLVVVDDRADQALRFTLEDDQARRDERLLLPMFGSRTGAVAEGPNGAWYESGGRFTRLVGQRRSGWTSRGTVVTTVLDGGEHGCVWHRLAVDGCIPPGTGVIVWSRTADAVGDLAERPWQREPAPYLRRHDAELAWLSPEVDPEHGRGTWELLFQHAIGRHLQLRFELTGDGRRTPRLEVARIHHPRFSYLAEYLPDVYAADPTAASFLDRWLANIEGVATRLEDRVADAQRLHGVDTTPDEALTWLASWVGATLDRDASDDDRRLVLRHAMDLHRERGTRPGMLRALRLATCPVTEELLTAPPRDGVGFTVRLSERWATRTLPTAAAFRAVDQQELGRPRLVRPGERWEPGDGYDELLRRWREYLEATGRASSLPVPVGAADDAARDAWQEFVRASVAVAWAATSRTDRAAWQEFLEHRHGTPEAWRRAWGTIAAQPASFDDVELPTELPSGAAFGDWVDFVTVALPARRAAHRVEVLVPIHFDDLPEQRQRRRDRAAAAVAGQRPAHVQVTVRSYWAACRVGACRVGRETVVGEGSRYAAIALGTTALALGRLTDPQLDDPARSRVGRDAVADLTVGGTPPSAHHHRPAAEDEQESDDA